MKTTDSITVCAAREFLVALVCGGYVSERCGVLGLPRHPATGIRRLGDLINMLQAEIEEAQLDNSRCRRVHECRFCGCDDLPLVFCSGPHGTVLRCSDCARHMGHHPIPLWGDYCGGAK